MEIIIIKKKKYEEKQHRQVEEEQCIPNSDKQLARWCLVLREHDMFGKAHFHDSLECGDMTRWERSSKR